MTVQLRTLGLVALLVLVLATAIAALALYFGVYNIAATTQHTRPVYWLMDYAMQRSIRVRTDPAAVPDLAEPARVRSGASLYGAHCLQCHGAPGVAPQPFAMGMTPAPANLVATARHWTPEALFWAIKHGIKMTGMPAWEYRLGDREIWDIVAFVEAMVRLSPQEYAALADALPAHQHTSEFGARPGPRGAPLGNATAGRRAVQQYLCATCHTIPGIVSANRHVGPPLGGMARRHFIAGIVNNTPENMERFLKDPQRLDPLTAMPALGLTDKDARDIAAFLYTLD